MHGGRGSEGPRKGRPGAGRPRVRSHGQADRRWGKDPRPRVQRDFRSNGSRPPLALGGMPTGLGRVKVASLWVPLPGTHCGPRVRTRRLRRAAPVWPSQGASRNGGNPQGGDRPGLPGLQGPDANACGAGAPRGGAATKRPVARVRKLSAATLHERAGQSGPGRRPSGATATAGQRGGQRPRGIPPRGASGAGAQHPPSARPPLPPRQNVQPTPPAQSPGRAGGWQESKRPPCCDREPREPAGPARGAGPRRARTTRGPGAAATMARPRELARARGRGRGDRREGGRRARGEARRREPAPRAGQRHSTRR